MVAYFGNTFFTLALALSVTLVPTTHAAPTRAYALSDNSSGFLRQNGLDAQKLNAQFASLTSSDSCTEGDQACVQGSFAQCINGTWTMTLCSGGTSCFALPLVKKAGTSIACDTQDDALSRITATGVQDGITGNGSNSTEPSSVPSSTPASEPPASFSATSSAVNSNPSSTPDSDDCEDNTGNYGDDSGDDCTETDSGQPSQSSTQSSVVSIVSASDPNDIPCTMTDSSNNSAPSLIHLNRRGIIFSPATDTPSSSPVASSTSSSSTPSTPAIPVSTPQSGSSSGSSTPAPSVPAASSPAGGLGAEPTVTVMSTVTVTVTSPGSGTTSGTSSGTVIRPSPTLPPTTTPAPSVPPNSSTLPSSSSPGPSESSSSALGPPTISLNKPPSSEPLSPGTSSGGGTLSFPTPASSGIKQGNGNDNSSAVLPSSSSPRRIVFSSSSPPTTSQPPATVPTNTEDIAGLLTATI